MRVIETAKAAQASNDTVSSQYTTLKAENLSLKEQIFTADSTTAEIQTILKKEKLSTTHYKKDHDKYRKMARIFKTFVNQLKTEVNQLKTKINQLKIRSTYRAYEDTDSELQKFKRNYSKQAPTDGLFRQPFQSHGPV